MVESYIREGKDGNSEEGTRHHRDRVFIFGERGNKVCLSAEIPVAGVVEGGGRVSWVELPQFGDLRGGKNWNTPRGLLG